MIKTANRYFNIGLAGKLELIDYYNHHVYPLIKPGRKYRMKQTDEWCAMFTSCIAYMKGIPANHFPYEVSVAQQVQWAKENGAFTRDVRMVDPGDLIVYDWKLNGTFTHVGFVEMVNGNEILTIEGNYSGTVGKRRIKADSKYIAGYIQI
ncbi:CHAP domain-containing protein [Herbiconiux daphne]|uniref:CHAP domain-containing protein n=1 Tax=Herbiconiux daphne TaxID=2970914 RepID=A0ABT2HB74_9MICO|nr:CHAP domain-containing protein [Herbiconiux daphne]MCS5737206.1 CHAP domain-containing protein [Herbiconiux daphne]